MTNNQPVNIGTSPNDGTGDPLRTMGTKYNAHGHPIADVTGLQTALAAAATGLLNAADYGAVGNGSTDDIAALNALVSAAVAGGYRGVMLPWTPTSYAVSNTWAIPATLDVMQYAPVKYIGSGNVACIRIGDVDVLAFNKTYRLWVQRTSVSTWLNDASVGIDLINPNQCRAEIIEASYFTVGLRVHGLSSASAGEHGATWSQFVLRYFVDNGVDIDLVADGPGGYANHNLFIGGSLNSSSNVPNPTVDKIGIRLRRTNGATAVLNNNVFVSPSIELHASGRSGLSIPVDIASGRYNQFTGCRHESNNALFMRVTGTDSWDNIADILYTEITNYAGLISDVSPGYNDVTAQETIRGTRRRQSRNISTTFATTMSWDLYAKPRTTIALTSNATLNVADISQLNAFGGHYTLHVYQDGVGSRILTLGTNFQYSPAIAPLKTGANLLTVLQFEGTGSGVTLISSSASVP